MTRCRMYVLSCITDQLSEEVLLTSDFIVVMYSCQLISVTEMVRTEVNMWWMACNYVLSNQNIFITVLWHTTVTKPNELSLTNLYITVYIMLFKCLWWWNISALQFQSAVHKFVQHSTVPLGCATYQDSTLWLYSFVLRKVVNINVKHLPLFAIHYRVPATYRRNRNKP
jgi:hypothetical protein